jgi:hypothetical protein
MQHCATHELRRYKRTHPRRRCWTEICRKIDGFQIQIQTKSKTPKEEPITPTDMCHPYTSTCFELFITPESTKFLQMGQPEMVT